MLGVPQPSAHGTDRNLSLLLPEWRKDELSPISQAGKQGRKRGAEVSMAMVTVQSGMPKTLHFSELYNGIFYTAVLLSFSCNCPGFQVSTLSLKSDIQNMRNV